MIKCIISFIFILFMLVGCNKDENVSTNNNTNISKISSVVNNVNETININKNAFEEINLSSYTTKMLDDTPTRVNNIQITCNLINNKEINPGETFSYYETVGKATSDKGYQEATILDSKGNKLQGLGGGNCQVSSTMYCAVLEVPELEVVERHAHSKPVAYVPKDKDATISYGSCDFRFKNNTASKIKIYASATNKEVTIRITSIK